MTPGVNQISVGVGTHDDDMEAIRFSVSDGLIMFNIDAPATDAQRQVGVLTGNSIWARGRLPWRKLDAEEARCLASVLLGLAIRIEALS